MKTRHTRFFAKARKMRIIGLLIVGWIVAGLAGTAEAQVAAGRRVALVIGNAAYIESPLPNPINDARAMGEALKQRGFDVILRENTSKLDLERAVADFGEQLQQGATGLFYYAGHGMQVNGRNFLIPVDAKIPSEQRVRLEAVDVDLVLEQMQAARSTVNLVILDACRNNPFEKRFRSAGGGGLAQINAPEGTLIAYATAPGSVAADGTSKNSLYTEELLKAMQAPGAKVEEVFKSVRVAVSRRSNGAQTPWEASSLTGDFYFVPPPPPPKPEPVAVAPPPPPPPVAAPAPVESGPNRAAMELAFWDSVKGSSSPSELQAYLTQFPEGTFAPLARARIATLTAPPPPVARAAPVPAAPATTPQPSVAAPPQQMAAQPGPQQMAALPPATGPLSAAAFDGTYAAQVRLSNLAEETAVITIKDLRISGRVGSECTLSGRLEDSGEIRDFMANCMGSGRASGTVRYAGRFAPDPANGQIVGKTVMQSPGMNFHGMSNTWTQSNPPSAAAAQPATAPQQMAALPQAGAPLPAEAFDGNYFLTAPLRIGSSMQPSAVLTIKDLRITGQVGSECTINGRLEASGQIRDLNVLCSGSGAGPGGGAMRFKGSFGLDPVGGVMVGQTVVESPGTFTNGSRATWARR